MIIIHKHEFPSLIYIMSIVQTDATCSLNSSVTWKVTQRTSIIYWSSQN